MTYRDAPRLCPQGGEELVQRRDRDKWSCPGCAGILVGASELERELDELGLEVLLDTVTSQRSTRPCPQCREPMTAFVLHGIVLDRCSVDGCVWFDRGELGRVRASIPEPQPLVVRLIDALTDRSVRSGEIDDAN
jgi:Zn-finger nucleic acid-binding protein